MGTRSIVLVKQSKDSKITVKRLYKHWDGYPTENLKMIHQALLCYNGTLDDFVSHCEKYYERDDMVEEIFETSQNEPFNPEFLGNQWDLEWIYTIDLDKKQVKVFGGGYTGKAPQIAYQNGTVDPLKYADCLIDQYQASERDDIQENIDSIKQLGYSLNNKRS